MSKLAKCMMKLITGIIFTCLFSNEVLAADQPVISNVLAISKSSGMVWLRGSGFGQDPQVILTGDNGSQKIQPLSAYGGTWLSFKLPPSTRGSLSVVVANGGVTSNSVSVSMGQALGFTRRYSPIAAHIDTRGGATSSDVSRTVSGVSISAANAAIQPVNSANANASLNAGLQAGSSANTSSISVNQNVPRIGGGTATAVSMSSASKPIVAPVKPVIFNAPLSVRAGDIVGLQGENFGATPKVQLVTTDGTQEIPVINSYGGMWVSFKVPTSVKGFLAAKVISDVATSDLVKLNAAIPYHLDATVVAPGGAFRVFGRSLLVAGYVPKVLVNGAVAIVDLTKSSEHMLVVTAPSIISGGAKTDILVSNGSGDGFTMLDRDISVIRGFQGDPFGLGVGWAAGFSRISNNILDPLTSPLLKHHMVCDGHTDDSEALADSINYLTGNSGGIVQLPDAVCYLKYSVSLRNNVVVQGGGMNNTTLLYDSDGAVFGGKLEWIGVRNLTFKNNGKAKTGPSINNSHFAFMQNVKIQLGNSKLMWLSDNQDFVFKDNDVLNESQGPYYLNNGRGLVFEGNKTRFSAGVAVFASTHEAVIINNIFERDASIQYSSPAIIHTIAIDFAYRISLINNQLNVLNGPVTKKNRNDGEAILTEGGGAQRTENLGYIQTADATSFTDRSNVINVTPFQQNQIPENYGVAIISGKGMGQTRRVITYANGKAMIDQPWDSIPDKSSHYATFVWGLEKSTIANNKLNGNPRGIWLYQTAMREVDVVGNQITEGGGIYLRSAQNVTDKLFTPIYGVRIADNKISNQAKNWGSYINNFSVQMDPSDFGVSSIGVEVRNNTLVANVPNVINSNEDYSSNEGLMNIGKLEVIPLTPLSLQTRILGTIIQGNKCLNCPAPDYQAASQGTVFSQ